MGKISPNHESNAEAISLFISSLINKKKLPVLLEGNQN